MSPERWERVESIFQEALEKAVSERGAFLSSSCGEDLELRHAVEEALAAFDSGGSQLGRAVGRAAAEVVAGIDRPIGSTVGAYRLRQLLGRGGMGEVYLAEDTRLGRPVALKFLQATFTADPSRLGRFRQEARTASALNHPNIVTVYEIGEDRGQHFIATEYVDGRTLRELLAEGPLPFSRSLDIALQTATALDAAHRAGVVHRDIKPENLMVRLDGYVKVLDFGLAKLMGESPPGSSGPAALTHAGLIVGTIGYMSPEQARGQAVDARSDLFSLGVALYEMLSDCAPFTQATAADTIAALLDREPPPLSADPPGIVPVVERLLAKNPEERYATSGEVIEDLRRLRLEPDSKERTAAGIDGPRRGWRNWRTFPTIGGIAIILIFAGLSTRGLWLSPGRKGYGPIRSIAVLPLENLSGDPAQNYFADGITDELTTELARISSLRVISRTSTVQYAEHRKSVPQVAKELNVDAVIAGSVALAGGKVRITAQLIDARIDAHLWAQSYERELGEVLELQDSVALDIASHVEASLSPEEHGALTSRRSVKPEAYEAYLEGDFRSSGNLDGNADVRIFGTKQVG